MATTSVIPWRFKQQRGCAPSAGGWPRATSASACCPVSGRRREPSPPAMITACTVRAITPPLTPTRVAAARLPRAYMPAATQYRTAPMTVNVIPISSAYACSGNVVSDHAKQRQPEQQSCGCGLPGEVHAYPRNALALEQREQRSGSARRAARSRRTSHSGRRPGSTSATARATMNTRSASGSSSLPSSVTWFNRRAM